jgi:hypothetical protein
MNKMTPNQIRVQKWEQMLVREYEKIANPKEYSDLTSDDEKEILAGIATGLAIALMDARNEQRAEANRKFFELSNSMGRTL